MSRELPVLDIVFPSDPPRDLSDAISTALHDLTPSAVQELEDGGGPVWRVFFHSADTCSRAEATLREHFAALGVSVMPRTVPDDDWAARSQAALTHVRVRHIVVAPPWDVPSLAPDDTLVIIKPSMGFGTGHHETTRLCLELLQQVDCRGRDVTDMGTGSGVLGIAAARRGARDVLEVDNDPDAVACAVENITLNAAADPTLRGRIRATVGSLEEHRPAADVVLANLTGAALTRFAEALLAQAASGGCLILSGFVASETDAVVRAFADRSHCEALMSEGEWRAVLLRKGL